MSTVSEAARILNIRLADDDDSKAFMLMIDEREAVHIKELTERAKMSLVKLGRMQMVGIRKGTINGAPHAWVVLTRDGKELINALRGEWTDELQKWAELEGEAPILTTPQEQEAMNEAFKNFKAYVKEEKDADL